jgi:hypothetical protein
VRATRIVLATHFLCPSFADYEANRFAPGNEREAKRRKAHANHCRRANKWTQFAPLICIRGGCAPCRGALAFRRFDRGSRQGLPSLLNSRPCFLGLGIRRALPALSCPSPVTAPHASAVVPKGMMPKAAPERVASPRGGTALAPSSESALAGRAVNAIIAPAMSVSAPTGSMRLPLRSHRGLLCCSRVTASNNAATDGTGG